MQVWRDSVGLVRCVVYTVSGLSCTLWILVQHYDFRASLLILVQHCSFECHIVGLGPDCCVECHIVDLSATLLI